MCAVFEISFNSYKSSLKQLPIKRTITVEDIFMLKNRYLIFILIYSLQKYKFSPKSSLIHVHIISIIIVLNVMWTILSLLIKWCTVFIYTYFIFLPFYTPQQINKYVCIHSIIILNIFMYLHIVPFFAISPHSLIQ